MNAVTALDLKENETKFPHLRFGCPVIDNTVGHILSSGITELSGEAGAGKSQVCMHLALRCQLSPELGGCGGTAAYMSCGEGEFPIRRLSQMAAAMTKDLHNQYAVATADVTATNVTAAGSEAETNASSSATTTPDMPASTSAVTPKLGLEHIFIEEIANHEHLRESLEKKLPDMCRDKNVKLLIIDR